MTVPLKKCRENEREIRMLHNIYFSGKGTTKFCAEWIGEHLHRETKIYNWFAHPCIQPLEIPEADVLLLSMPVYGGFIPQICVQMAEKLKGNNTPAIIAAVYGNRHYDHALLEMNDILTRRGFVVIGAGAFVAEHSLFPSVGTGRPDEKDKEAMAEFSKTCKNILKRESKGKFGKIHVPGIPGYDESSYKGFSIKPTGNAKCIKCGKCAGICPQKAINAENFCETDRQLCIACGACIKYCPVGARGYHDVQYREIRINFEKKYSAYRLPEMYYAELLD